MSNFFRQKQIIDYVKNYFESSLSDFIFHLLDFRISLCLTIKYDEFCIIYLTHTSHHEKWIHVFSWYLVLTIGLKKYLTFFTYLI